MNPTVPPARQIAIEALADEVREILGIRKPPVDPFAIAATEGIELLPGQYGDDFSGRIEYHPDLGAFLLFHPLPQAAQYESVVRFSVAHELGHYYIPEHAKLLRAGEFHNSTPGFISDNVLEREADYFAGSLLLPGRALREKMGRRGWLDLEGILDLARACKTSATSAAVRYANFAEEACALVVSKNGSVLWAVPSQEAVAIGLRWFDPDGLPPDNPSRTAAHSPNAGRVFQGASHTGVWCRSSRSEIDLWEEAFPLGRTGLVLTLLSIKSD